MNVRMNNTWEPIFHLMLCYYHYHHYYYHYYYNHQFFIFVCAWYWMCLWMCLCMCMCLSMRVCMCTCMCACTCMYMYMYSCACMCVFAVTHVLLKACLQCTVSGARRADVWESFCGCLECACACVKRPRHKYSSTCTGNIGPSLSCKMISLASLITLDNLFLL